MDGYARLDIRSFSADVEAAGISADTGEEDPVARGRLADVGDSIAGERSGVASAPAGPVDRREPRPPARVTWRVLERDGKVGRVGDDDVCSGHRCHHPRP